MLTILIHCWKNGLGTKGIAMVFVVGTDWRAKQNVDHHMEAYMGYTKFNLFVVVHPPGKGIFCFRGVYTKCHGCSFPSCYVIGKFGNTDPVEVPENC